MLRRCRLKQGELRILLLLLLCWAARSMRHSFYFSKNFSQESFYPGNIFFGFDGRQRQRTAHATWHRTSCMSGGGVVGREDILVDVVAVLVTLAVSSLSFSSFHFRFQQGNGNVGHIFGTQVMMHGIFGFIACIQTRYERRSIGTCSRLAFRLDYCQRASSVGVQGTNALKAGQVIDIGVNFLDLECGGAICYRSA